MKEIFKRRLMQAAVASTIMIAPYATQASLWEKDAAEEPTDTPIVRWWDDGLAGTLYLLQSVIHLNENNIIDSNGTYPDNVACDADTAGARTTEGHCNDLNQTRMGSQGVRFGRNVPLEAAYADEAMLMEPNPRTISRELMTRDGIKEVDFLSYWAAAWIQFMTHDWFSHKDAAGAPHELPLDADDPLAGELGSSMAIAKTEVDPTWTPYENTPKAYTNRLTHWWDGSQLYGSDQAVQDSLRTFEGGRLIIEDSGRLAVNPDTGLPVTGFNDNWWLGLQMFHELFVKEHNAIADMLAAKYPSWTDQQLFNKARLINAAVMAKIHTVDWTPAILNTTNTKLALNLDWAVAVGGDKNLRDTPYSLTEEFVAVYRMHPLIRDSVEMVDYQSGTVIKEISTTDQAFQKAPGVLDALGNENVYYSFGMTHPGQLTPHNYPKFLQELRMPDGRVMDMAALDILRDRERGVPRYNEFRRQLDMPPINDFTDLTPDKALAEKMRAVYNNDVELIDTVVGQLAEGYRPEGFGFSDTTFRIFTVMAPRRFQADRFYTTDFNSRVYTREGMAWIKDANFKSVILRHEPELEKKMTLVGNPFFPWDTDSCDWRLQDKLKCDYQRLKLRFGRN
ncbi:peroxidase family protein [Allohahella marinimesophila]|uniref:Peroxidase family protein n=1 Tax=Allohahella marinimesophila TaxID=1054972 RepID=A0ABP7NZZ1_9GAMM